RDFHVTGVQTCALPISSGVCCFRFVALLLATRQSDGDRSVARLHFRNRSCWIGVADPDQGKNRTRRPLSFIGFAHARGPAASCGGATLLVRLSPGRSDRLLPVRSGVEHRGAASPGQAIAACSFLLAGRCTIGCRSQASASWSSSRASIAHSCRACLLAIATSTLPKGRRLARSRIQISSGPALSAAVALARCRLLLAPWISRVRR